MKFSLLSRPSILSLITILLVGSLAFAPAFVSAWVVGDPIVPCGLNDVPCKVCHIFPLVNNVISFILLGLAMPFAVVMILLGGILMVTGAGNPIQGLLNGGTGNLDLNNIDINKLPPQVKQLLNK